MATTLPTIPADAEMPAFRLLTDLQQRFVMCLLKYGSGKGTRSKCAREAGYTGDDDTLKVTAHVTFHNVKVQRALKEVAAAHLASFALFSIDGIAQLAESATKEEVKLKALIALADRTGFHAIQQIDVRKEDVNRSEDQKIEQMVAICIRRPELLVNIAEPRRSLIEAKIAERNGVAPAITAEYVEIDPDDALLGVV